MEEQKKILIGHWYKFCFPLFHAEMNHIKTVN